MLNPDGSIAFSDSQAGLFHTRYVLPVLQYPETAQNGSNCTVSPQLVTAAVGVWAPVPGVRVAAFPLVEKKQILGVMLLAAKSEAFDLNEDTLRICSRLGLDAQWLNQQSLVVPAYSEEAISAQARMLMNMVRDQVRLTGLEHELDSLSNQLANTYEELSLIYQISSGMRVNRRASEFFKQACLDVLEVMCVRGVGVALRASDVHRQEPVIYGAMSLPPGLVHRLSDELMVRLRQRKTSLLINDLSADPSLAWLGEFAQQILVVPLQRQEQILGCMFALQKDSGEFDSVDSKLLNSIANESAIYLENAMLFDDVHGLMMGLLHSLTSAVDAKDAYTCGHSERVALIGRELALASGMTDSQVERIYMGGLLHDVGKIGVPELVLQKAGRLTQEEFEQIKRHPAIGAKILHDIKQISDIIPGVMHHHERYDGKGYPSGLAGEQIPLMGRIICLADCFDAMTTSRTYRKALPLEVALAEIRRCAGTQFDPALAEAFLHIGIDRLRELLADYQTSSRKMLELRDILHSADK